MTPDATGIKKKCFVLSPIGDDGSPERKEADKVLKHLIRGALEPNFRVERADDSSNPGAITPTIVAGILGADLIVANLSGANPNVFYELAMAHGYSKPAVHIQKAGEPVAFDVKDMRIVPYTMDPDDLETARTRLAKYASFAMDNPAKVETPLTSAAKFLDVQGSTDPVAESNVLVIEAIAEVHKDVKRALSRRNSAIGLSASVQRETLAHVQLMKMIIERVVEAGRTEESDFKAAISPATSEKYDAWAREQLSKATGIMDEGILNEVLFDADVVSLLEDDGIYDPEAMLNHSQALKDAR